MSVYTTVSEFRKGVYNWVDKVCETHRPLRVAGKRNNIVVIAEEDFEAMQETLYLLSVPNMRESILKARAEPLEKCADNLKW